MCSCRGMCLKDNGRNACPCKTIGQYCTSACHPDAEIVCMNSRKYFDTDSSEQSSDSSETSRRGARARGRRGRSRGRSLGRSQGTGEERSRSRQRRPSRRGRAGGRGRGRGRGPGRGTGRGRHLVQEGDMEQRLVNHEQQLQNLVDGLGVDVLRRLAAELLRRQPAVFADLVNGEILIRGQPQLDAEVPQPAAEVPQPGPEAPQLPADGTPDWCHCGHCQVMPTQLENKCCCRRRLPCISTTPHFQQLVLDGNVLDIAMRYREDVLALDHPRNNENFRHTAYRQFVLWQHGRLGQGNRRVVPSCCVLAIRARYPSPNGIYTGYRPSRL